MSSSSDQSAEKLRTLFLRVADACTSSDEEMHLAGEVGRELVGEITDFRLQVLDPTTEKEIGVVDVETARYLIKVSIENEGLLPVLLQFKNDPLFNPARKKVLLYAPHYTPEAAREVIEESILIFQSLERLIDYVKKRR
jgi:hypothetical protein